MENRLGDIVVRYEGDGYVGQRNHVVLQLVQQVGVEVDKIPSNVDADHLASASRQHHLTASDALQDKAALLRGSAAPDHRLALFEVVRAIPERPDRGLLCCAERTVESKGCEQDLAGQFEWHWTLAPLQAP